MKKLIATVLVLTMALSLAACTTNEPAATTTAEPTTTVAEVNIASALELLSTIYGAYDADNKPMVMGGAGDTASFEGPGAIPATDADSLAGQLNFPADQVANISDAASMMFAMNANSLTAGAFKVTGDVTAFTTALKDSVMNAQWMCGFPEKLVIYTVGSDYVVMAYGLAGVSDPMGDFMKYFNQAVTAAYPEAQLVVDQAIG